MKSFNVLDRALDVHQHYLLEASAGTGKTFSIQNIVVRLLIEAKENEETLPLSKILVVTFTKAATRDLKVRIRTTIEQVHHDLQHWLTVRTVPDETADFVKACIEKGEKAVHLAIRRLQEALFSFDQAQVFTIHAFCARMLRQFALESDLGLHAFAGEEPLPVSEVLGIIRDYFRTEVRLEHYTPGQIDILLKGDPEQKKLIKYVQSGHPFVSLPPLRDVLKQFNEICSALKTEFGLIPENIVTDFQAQAAAYCNHKSCGTKAEALEKIVRFAALFDKSAWSIDDLDLLIRDGVIWAKALDPSLRKARASIPPLHYPGLTAKLQQELHPLIEESRRFPDLLCRFAGDCRRLFHRHQNEEERLSPDDVLRKMGIALEETNFTRQVQNNFQVAIIDEFQDTDPLQWQIFQRLFLPADGRWKGCLYLVGDPKQSIYSFRQADIYTYLSAAKALGEGHCYSLNVNYRSQQRLVDALNQLFSADHLPILIPLPKHSSHLPYQPVRVSEKSQEKAFQDIRGAVHFIASEGGKKKLEELEQDVFLPFIASEILRLKSQKQLNYSQFAILVRDRLQAARLAEFLKMNGIPTINQRGENLAESPALQAFTEFMQALVRPRHRGNLRTALGNPLLEWMQEDLTETDAIEYAMSVMQRLKKHLIESGFASFFQKMLHTSFRVNGKTILQTLLSREGGVAFYRDLQQIGEIIIDHQHHEWHGIDGIIPFIDQFKVWNLNEDERLKSHQDPSEEGVKVLTIHSSKGLEFDIVFALGLMNRTKVKEELFPLECQGKTFLSPLVEGSLDHRRYCEEVDAEKMRQLYVALTRAKAQLYIPVVFDLPSKKISYGEASPMDLFLARLGQPSADYETLYERIRDSDGHCLIDFIEQKGKDHAITYSIHREVIVETLINPAEISRVLLKEPPRVEVSGLPLKVTSFTTLSQESTRHSMEESLFAPPHDYRSTVKTPLMLPANSETGVIVHTIMEKINFTDFLKLMTPYEALPFICPYVQNPQYQEWVEALSALVFNAVKTPLAPVAENFCLAQTDPYAQYREMPFLYPGLEGMLLKGVIDYLFIHDGRYYLIDWKTNWLGPTYENYDLSSMKTAMEQNDYFLQASIYTEALKRFLKCVDSRPFQNCFGGVFYLFLRGMQPDRTTGIYHFFPTQDVSLC